MCEKKRIIIFGKDEINCRLDFDYITDDVFEKAVTKTSDNFSIAERNLICYTLGTKEEMEEGTVYFCPTCGYHNEMGYEPEINQVFKRNEKGEFEVYGKVKILTLECMNCDKSFEIYQDGFGVVE